MDPLSIEYQYSGTVSHQGVTDEHHTPTETASDSVATDGQPDDASHRVVSTGIESLDRKLDGGFPTGSIVAIAARPEGQSELVLGEFIDGQTVTYLTVERDPDTIARYHDACDISCDEIEVHRLDSDDPLADAQRHLDDLTEPTIVVFDPIRSLERQPEPSYTEFLHELSDYVIETDSIAYLHCIEGNESAGQHDLTMYLADVVILLETDTSGDRVETTLCIPKLRGGDALEDVIKLDLSGEVDIDVTRKIA